MIKRFVIILLLLFQGFCFAYTKQSDEYSCGVFSAYNLIENSCKDCSPIEYNKLRLLFKTDENEVVIKGNDPMKKQRENFYEKYLSINEGHVGEKIVEIVKKELSIK